MGSDDRTTGQLSFAVLDYAQEDDNEPSLHQTTFVVVDLETTGGRASAPAGAEADAITEIAAVKVRAGAVIGEFATLVDPGRDIPPRVSRLTGITADTVRNAPPVAAVLPSFLEFAGFDRGAVLVAHNAAFDVRFLIEAARRHGFGWSRPPVLCTVRLARRLLSREEAPSVRLAELVRLFSVVEQPTHRALDDARAAVGVLHALIDRLADRGVHTVPGLRGYLAGVSPARRAKRGWAAALPNRPGVYLFRGPSGEVLYVGTATDLRRRVGQYFTGSERRARIAEMVELAGGIDHVECAHPLEAGVRELRLLAAHAPPYNRKSRFPRRRWWLALTEEGFPRLVATRNPRVESVIGPFRSRTTATETATLIAHFTGIRTCTARLGRTVRHDCPASEVAPCPATRGATADEYAAAVTRTAALIDGTDNTAFADALHRIRVLADQRRYENAARLRDRTAAAVEAVWRAQRLRALVSVSELIAAAPAGDGWHLAVIRRGRLAAAGLLAPGVAWAPAVDAFVAGAQVVIPEPGPLGGALVEETGLIIRWLTRPGVQIARIDDKDGCGWSSPLHSAGSFTAWAAVARSARLAAESDLLGETHPASQEVSCRTRIDGLRRPSESVLPGGLPLGRTG